LHSQRNPDAPKKQDAPTEIAVEDAPPRSKTMAEQANEEHSRHGRDEYRRHDRDDDGHQDRDDRDRFESANDIVKDYALWAGGFGLVPLPILDIAAITATQVRMASELNKHYRRWHPERYRHRFSHERLRSIIVSLIGSTIPVAAGSGVGSLLKAIPLIGQALGLVTTPVFAWASTVAVGRVFIEHFESGGTLLDFDAEKMRHYYYEQFEAAKHGSKVRDGKEEANNSSSANTRAGKTTGTATA
jgi:uncharacterized protein (DUF697 family)